MKMISCFYSKFYAFNQRIQYNVLLHSTKYRCYTTDKFKFTEQTVQIRTCGHLYKKWREEKLFSNLPTSDLIFNVPYIDTSLGSSNNCSKKPSRTVLALHGAPGSWRDFIYLTSYLHQRGYRVIAPSFPDFHVYRPGIYRHTDLEKAEYVKDFLAAISVSHVDLLVCHSGSTYPGLNLCLSNDSPKIKSLALLNPGTFNIKGMSGTKAVTSLKLFAKAGENPVSLKFLEICGPFILKNILNIRVRFESILDPLLSITTMMHAHIPESKEKFLQIVARKLPVLHIFSEKDPLMSTKPSYELAELLGAHALHIFTYNKEGVLIQEGKATQTLKVLAFQEGSHYVFLKHPEIINKEVADFLDLHN